MEQTEKCRGKKISDKRSNEIDKEKNGMKTD